MKILYLSLNSLVMDGWSYQENLLSKAHAALGHEVTIITSHWIFDSKGELAMDARNEYVDENGVKIVRLSMKGKESHLKKVKSFPKLEEAIYAEKPDFIFIHSVNFVDVPVVTRYLKKHPQVAACADNHGDFSNSAKTWLSKNILHKILWKHYAKKLVPYVKKFYGVLPARVDFLTDIYKIPKEKTDLLVMGVDDSLREKYCNEAQAQEVKEKFGFQKEDFLIVTGGKIDPAKTQTLLLMQAVNALEDKRVKLLVFGSIDERLKGEFDALCSERVVYGGWASTEESYQYFAAADFIVFPGRHSVYWEQAVGLGKPLMVKYWAGTTHVDLGGNALFLKEDSVEEIVKNIRLVVEDEGVYQKMKQCAEEKGIEAFSYQKIAEKCLRDCGASNV